MPLRSGGTNGGSLQIFSGITTTKKSDGVTSFYSVAYTATSPGAINVQSKNVGTSIASDNVNMKSDHSVNGNSSTLSFVAGSSLTGSGGAIEIDVGSMNSSTDIKVIASK